MAKAKLALHQEALLRILLVEDNPADAMIVENLLDEVFSGGYAAEHCLTQSTALKRLENETFDVCLLDLTLPDVNGFSALIGIQEIAPDMPVLILTGVNDMAVAKKAVGQGAQDYLLKDKLDQTILGNAIEYARERKRIEKELFQRANFDYLTGLANRRLFENRLWMALARVKRGGTGVALLIMDLDRFKLINDAYGHDAGDEVLRTVAKRLTQTVRVYDTAARFGGDEFAVLLEGISAVQDAVTRAKKIIETLAEPIPYGAHRLEVKASIGIAFAEDPTSCEALLQHADKAMYHAKKENGNGYRLYPSEAA